MWLCTPMPLRLPAPPPGVLIRWPLSRIRDEKNWGAGGICASDEGGRLSPWRNRQALCTLLLYVAQFIEHPPILFFRLKWTVD